MKRIIPGILLALAAALAVYSCSSSEMLQQSEPSLKPISEIERPSPDPRVGLQAGLFDAEEAIWNLELVSTTPPPEKFVGSTNSDLAFKDQYAIQGNYNGFVIWDLSDPANPEVAVDFLCPASQSDVSVYQNLLFVSGEGLGGRLDCGTEGVQESVSPDRLRGIRIFDISDIENPEYISNVQTCRGSHTHSVLVDPDDSENVYVYISGSAPVRPEDELPGCTSAAPNEDPDSALFRIEVIKVPLANPELAAIANSPRIFEDLTAPPRHGLSPADIAELEKAKEEGAFVGELGGRERIIPGRIIRGLLMQMVEERGGTGEPTAADSANLREMLPEILAQWNSAREQESDEEQPGPNQCHDITLYPEAGLAGGACEGYGLLLDISDPVNPVRIDAVADSNFAYWHSATFNNDATSVLFTDEWGGGGQPKCREADPMEWGANAIFSINDGKMDFQSYFKMPAPQTSQENCVAHNGSLIPIPDRDIMVQSWYQGGINIFDWTDPANPIEIAYHDRGPIDAEQMASGGSWSVYWYNGMIVNSEIARGLDVFELVASDFITQNEIDAANTVKMDYFNPQGQPKFEWPASYALVRAYADQLERNRELNMQSLQVIRSSVSEAEQAGSMEKSRLLTELATQVENMAGSSSNSAKINKLADTLKTLATN